MIKIENYFPLVKKILKRYENKGVEKDDLFQEGVMGLIEAKNNYKYDMNVNFATYAQYWIKKYILKSIDKNRKQKISMKKVFNKSFYQNTPFFLYDLNLTILSEIEKEVIEKFYLEEKTLEEISKELDLPRERIRQIKQKSLIKLKKIYRNLANSSQKINNKDVSYIVKG
ncbi:MAG: sigma-70 family RNA polymerase sigma factor [Candidatus Omnitrophica bacterium]|nr:sigma-70 family RNA polymerase sigma factor [Candidatus Omnitrophota bacterium]MCM8801780.1 sigma-70 family RNA polymerase sigma factor [Candidatus Omnitrophota bacterium]